jgi:drug/metabolite transporter (DMT)-like permease
MGKKEKLQKEIDIIEGKIKFFRNALLALVSALVWAIYAILEQKAGKEILVLAGAGAIVLIFIFLRVKSLESKQIWLLEELEKES